jgi:hypothetical protein
MATKETFTIRWRGATSGPYESAALKEMLGRGEVSLMHEVFADGRWVPLEDFFATTTQAPQTIAPPPSQPPPETSSKAPPTDGSEPPPLPPEELFYVAKAGRQEGPYSRATLRQLAAAGIVTSDDLAWKPGMPEWMHLGKMMADLPRPPMNPPSAPPINPPTTPPPPAVPSKPNTAATGAIAGGYICSLIALALFPPFFALAAFVCGIVALVNGRVGHGIAILLLSLVCGFFGMAMGVAAFS